MHRTFGFALLLLTGACVTAGGSGSGDGTAIACAESPIQSRSEGMKPAGGSDCTVQVHGGTGPGLTEHRRHFDYRSGFAEVVYSKPDLNAYLRHQPLRQALARLKEPRIKGFGFGETGKLSADAAEFEVVPFKVSRNVSCIGFANHGSARDMGHADHVFGYACRFAPDMGIDELRDFLSTLTIRGRA